MRAKECTEICWCSDCDNTECSGSGQDMSDCPRYSCVYKPESEEWYECQSCLWLKGYKLTVKERRNADK